MRPADDLLTTETVDDSGPWAPLRIRLYRALWIAGLVSNIGTFMHLVAASWAMTLVTDSPTLVGLVQTAWAVPGFLLALHAGAFVDMIDRRRLIVATQIAALAVAAVLGVLQATGNLPPLGLLAGTFLESVALTVAAPAFMALTPELVGPHRLAQALGLDSISRNIAQAVGPAIAGGVIALSGPGAVFGLNALSFVAVVIAVRGYHPPARAREQREPLGTVIRAGVRFIVGSLPLRRLATRLALSSTTTAALAALLPVVATSRLDVGSGGFGVLAAGLGVGSVVAVWVLPRIRAVQRPERAVLLAALVWSCGAALLAIGTQMCVAIVAVLLAGAGMMGVMNVLFATYTVQLQPWVRGRGSAIAMLMVWLGASAGAAGWGAAASAFGVRTAVLAAAVTNIVVAVAARWFLRIAAAPLLPDQQPAAV